MRVIISGGGTGGHVFPAIAVAQELRDRIPEVKILFVGAKGKMEMEKVPKAGFDIEGLWISGLQRKLTLRNLMFPIKLVSSLVKGFGIVNRFKPDVVVAFGGYASGPIAQVAAMKNIPVIVQEQNSYPGITNKILASKARKICVAYEGMEKYFPKEKIVYTGNPVRQDISELDKDINSSFKYFDLVQNKKTVLVFGGSLGAGSINEAVKHNLDSILKVNDDIQFIWQVGKLYFDEYSQLEIVKKNDNVKVFAFIDRMDLAYASADLVVCRAGALTISELCVAGKAAILVPSPNVAEDHQTKNAESLVKHNAVLMIPDKKIKSELSNSINSLMSDESKIDELVSNIKKLGKPNAAKKIVDTIMQYAG